MLANFSNDTMMNIRFKKDTISPQSRQFSWRMLIGLPAWVFTGFMLAQVLLVAVVWLCSKVGIFLPTDSVTTQTTITAIVYVLTLLIVIGVPWILQRRSTSREDIGLTRLPSWMDILLSPAGFIIYFILSGVLIAVATAVLPDFDVTQTQEVGFEDLSQRSEYLLAFLTLVVVAPVAEETLFRGYLYGKLKKHVPLWLAIVATSALFGAFHGQWNVALDTFMLSVVMCSLREVTGNIWAGILLHMMKNGIAFYFLFINPSILNTLGG